MATGNSWGSQGASSYVSFHPTPTFPRLFLKSCLLQKMLSPRIHENVIFTYIWMDDFYGFHVGKYNCPMDPMGLNATYQCFFPRVLAFRTLEGHLGFEKTHLRLVRRTYRSWVEITSRLVHLPIHLSPKTTQMSVNIPYPYHPCMIYLPTFTMKKINHSCIGKETSVPWKFMGYKNEHLKESQVFGAHLVCRIPHRVDRGFGERYVWPVACSFCPTAS